MTFEEYDKVVEIVVNTGEQPERSAGDSSFGQGYESCKNDVLQSLEENLWGCIDKKELEKKNDQ